MTIHRAPRESDPPDAILKDDCERCAEHAECLTLDDSSLRRLMARTYATERSDADFYRTATEAKAGGQLWRVALRINQVTGIPLGDLLPAAEQMVRR